MSSGAKSATRSISPVPQHSDIPEVSGAQLAAVYYGQRIGGDFYDFIRVSPNRVLFAILDAAGRNFDNRAILVAAQRALRSTGAKLLADDEANEADAMIALCIALNRTVMQASPQICACPAFAGCYREDLGTVCYFNAGHTSGLVRHGTAVADLPATGLPLGLFSHVTCDAPTIALPPSSSLVLVSRGVTEGKCKNDEFGLQRVKETLSQTTADSAKELCLAILDRLQQFMRRPPTHNDVTVLALRRQSLGKRA